MNKYVGIIIKEGSYLISQAPLIYHNYFHRNKISSEKRYEDLRKIIIKFSRIMGMEIILTGLKTFPCEQSFMLTPNHQSFMDALNMIEILDQKSTFVAKKEAKKYVLVGKAITSIDCEYLDRDNLRQEIELMKKIKVSLKEDNLKWIIFPEGTRNKTSKLLLPFKFGTVSMAQKTNATIIPFGIIGDYKFRSKNLTIKYGTPFKVKELT